jgi:hypothetical protein
VRWQERAARATARTKGLTGGALPADNARYVFLQMEFSAKRMRISGSLPSHRHAQLAPTDRLDDAGLVANVATLEHCTGLSGYVWPAPRGQSVS